MATVLGAFGTSHAYTFTAPDQWDERRKISQRNYEKHYGQVPVERAEIREGSLDDDRARYSRIRAGLDRIKSRLETWAPDAVILIGDDQNENFRADNIPQFSIFRGDQYIAVDWITQTRTPYRSDPELANQLLTEMVESGFDVSYSAHFANDELRSHAHTEPLVHLIRASAKRVVPLFVNAINIPAPTAARCYEFGQALGAALEAIPDTLRVVVGVSGGMSHFSPSFPWRTYKGTQTWGGISLEFDRQVAEHIREGRGSALQSITSAELLDHGEIELRQWIVLMGMLGNVRPTFMAYEPFFRGVMGMAAATWELRQ